MVVGINDESLSRANIVVCKHIHILYYCNMKHCRYFFQVFVSDRVDALKVIMPTCPCNAVLTCTNDLCFEQK